MDTIKDRKGKDLIEAKRLRRGGKNTQKNSAKKVLNDPDNHNDVAIHLQPDFLECEVKWAEKASGGDGIPAELFNTLKGHIVKGLYSIH